MLEARPVAERRCHSQEIAQAQPDMLEYLLSLVRALDVRQQRDIVALAGFTDICLECRLKRDSIHQMRRYVVVRDEREMRGAQRRLLLRQLVRHTVVLQQRAGPFFRLPHVWLIEGVDTEIRARDSRRELPPEELLAEVIRIGQRKRHDGLPGGLKRDDAPVLIWIEALIGAQVDK